VRPFGITSTPLTYDPPLPDGAKRLEFTRGSSEIQTDGLFDGARLKAPAPKLPKLASVPILVVTGEASYHATYDHLTVQFLQDTGVTVEHVYLADKGIHGNGHLMAIELNNKEIQTFVGEWIGQKVATSTA